MQAPKNVLLIVVDQWRGLMLPSWGPTISSCPTSTAVRAGRDLPQPFHAMCTLRAGAASLLTSLYLMNHRAVQNTVPLDARFTNLGHELRKGGYDPALVGYTTTTPDPRTTDAHDPRFLVLGDIMDGFRPVGAFEPYKDAYFGWVESQGLQAAAESRGHLVAPGWARRWRHGAAGRHPQGTVGHRLVHRARPVLPARPRRQAVVPASRLLPAPSALHRFGALQRHVPAGGHAQGGARGPRRRRKANSIRCSTTM